MLALDRLDIRRRLATQRELIMGTVLEVERLRERFPMAGLAALNAPAELYQLALQ